jgi:hypothetical protein
MGNWEVMKCYALEDGQLKLSKWGVKRWGESPEKFVLYETWNDVLNHINRNTLDNG